jgi:hypothetical protein
MGGDLDRWLKLAFDQADGPRANAAIAHHRGARRQPGLDPRSYEVVVADGESLAQVVARVHPRFALHMEALGLPRAGGPSLFFTVFAAGRVHFVEGAATVALFDQVAAAGAPPLALPGRPP